MDEDKNFIIVLKSGNGESISVEVYPEDTVKDLKERIENQAGIPLDFDQIKIDGKNFNDDTNIVEYFSSAEVREEIEDENSMQITDGIEEFVIPDDGNIESVFLSDIKNEDVKPKIEAAGLFCAAEGCSSNKFDTPDITLFRFPIQKIRCQQWAQAAGRKDLFNQSIGYLSHQFALCAKHFTKDQFASKDRRVLKQKAIPTLFNGEVEIDTVDGKDGEQIVLERIPIQQDTDTLLTLSSQGDVNKRKAPLVTNSAAVQKMLFQKLQSAEPGNVIFAESLEEEEEKETEEEEEDELEPEHPGSLCRLCASPLRESTTIFIFGEEGEKKGLAEKINACLPISVRKTDPLPKQICTRCIHRLEINHAFTETCIKAEIKLKALTKQFLIHQLKKPTVPEQLSSDKCTNKNKKNYCCPLCVQGKMKFHGNDKQIREQNIICVKKEEPDEELEIPTGLFAVSKFEPEDESHDFLNDLYSDLEDEISDVEPVNEEEKDPLSEEKTDLADSLYLQEDKVDMNYDCDICLECFSTPFECLEHCKTHAAVNNFPCLVCGLTFYTEEELQTHFGEHKTRVGNAKKQGKPLLECGACSSKFNTKKDFILHKCSKPILNVLQSDDVDLSCHICEKNFKTLERASIHHSYHEDSQKLICELCKKEFETEEILIYHVSTKHENQDPPSCQFCSLRFYSKMFLEKHEKIHEQTTYQCSLCSKTFKDLDVITRHVETHTNAVIGGNKSTGGALHCAKCDLKFPKKSLYLYHLEYSHEGDFVNVKRMPSLIQYQCKICSERFTSSQDVIIHRTTHWKSYDAYLPHVCEYCGEAHPSPNTLARHRRILHPDEKPYVCTVCEVRTRTLYEARVHRKTHTGYSNAPPKQQNRIYQCENCPSLFSDKMSFVYHKKSHKVTKGYQCEFCEKIFPERHRLIVHRRQHTGEKPFSCGVCGKKFAQTSAMYTHALLHTGETPHGCDLCGRRFRIKSDRDNHRRTHTGEKPYKCQYCEKTFRTGQVYYQHRMIHTGERRFPCDICGRAFKRSHTLVCHRRIHTGEKPNICDVCGRGFRQRTDMRKHKMNLHGVPA